MELPFNIDDYDVLNLGISGGKDSTALLLWAVFESGIPHEKIMAVFSDTDNEDSLTYSYIEMLNDNIFPIHVLHPELGFYELAKKKKRFPSRMGRFCTQHLKVIPSREHVLGLMRSGKRVLLLNGVRAGEAHNGNDRGSVPEFGYDDGYACNVYRPILSWSIDDVWAIHKRYISMQLVIDMVQNDPHLSEEHKVELVGKLESSRIPRNPLYEMGAKRVGCFPCINSNKAEIRAMAKFRPDRIDMIAEQEITIAPERGFASMFVPKTVPPRFRSPEWTKKETGEVFMLATIRDVVAWSQTGVRARGVAVEEIEICDSAAGACE